MTYRHNKNRVMKQCSTRRRIAVVACVVLFSVAVIGLSGTDSGSCAGGCASCEKTDCAFRRQESE